MQRTSPRPGSASCQGWRLDPRGVRRRAVAEVDLVNHHPLGTAIDHLALAIIAIERSIAVIVHAIEAAALTADAAEGAEGVGRSRSGEGRDGPRAEAWGAAIGDQAVEASHEGARLNALAELPHPSVYGGLMHRPCLWTPVDEGEDSVWLCWAPTVC